MARPGTLPTVIIIGAMKCATSSLHYYMSLHPSVWMSRRKELNFFMEEMEWGRGVEWYRSWFRTDLSVRGEASPGYTSYPQFAGVPRRMHEIVPDARLIYLVRDPIDRLISHYRHNVLSLKETRPLEEALADPSNRYIARSRYATQLERYLEFWPADRILVLKTESLRDERDLTLGRVFDFVGVQPVLRDPRLNWRRHQSSIKRQKTRLGRRLAETRVMKAVRKLPENVRWPIEDVVYFPFSRRIPAPRLDTEMRSRLNDVFRPELARLEAMTGISFDNGKA